MYARNTVGVAALVVGLAGVGHAAKRGAPANPNPGVAPPQSHPYGQTYAEWGLDWWLWGLSFGPECNPILDTAYDTVCGDADDQPDGPVWFLAGTFGGSVERHLHVPPGKALLVPIYNWLPWSPDDCPYLGLESPCEADDMLAALDANMEGAVGGLSASVDGVAIRDLGRYRARLGVPFTYDVVEGGLAAASGYPVGPRYPAISDGYYLMLNPLSRGEHTVQFAVEGFLNVTYHLTVGR